MAEHVVEDVRLLEIVELRALADEVAGREAAVAEMLEEDVVGDEPRHRHHRPAGAAEQPLVQLAELGHARMTQAQDLEALLEGVDRAAGERLLLAREQQVPDRMLLGAERAPNSAGTVQSAAAPGGGRVGSFAAPWRSDAGLAVVGTRSSTSVNIETLQNEKPRRAVQAGYQSLRVFDAR